MANEIFTFEEQDIDLKNSGKIKIKCFKDDDVTLNINVFNYGEGVDLSKYNKEIRFVKPNGDLYSESHKLEAKGNLLKIECSRQLTVMAGIVKGSIRLWNNENKQKRSYPIIVEVIENGEENLNSKNEISVKENLDDSINKALVLESGLNSSIKSSEEYKNALDESISNSNNTKIKLDESDKVAKDTKVKLDGSCSNGQNIIKSINDKIDVANKTKNNLDSSNIEADKVKNNLDNSKDDADKVKIDLNKIKDESKQISSSLNNSNETAKSNKQKLDEGINKSNSKINELNTAINLSENKNNELKSTNKISDINKKNLDVANTLAKSNIEEMKNFGDILSLGKDVNILKQQMPSNKNILEKVSQPSLDCWYDKYTKNEIDNKISQVITDLDWKESVNTFSDIAKTYPKPDDGWTVNVKDNNITYRYDGSKWIDISSNSIPLATSSLDGRMSKNDKSKLDGIAVNANNYVHPSTHSASMIVEDSSHRFITDTERNNLNDCNNKKHTHDNKSIIDKITQALLDNWNSAFSHVSDTVKHITSNERNLWNTVSNKVDKASGKQLSTNDYTTDEKNKLSGVATNANNYIHPVNHSADMIVDNANKRFTTDTEKSKWNTVDNKLDKNGGNITGVLKILGTAESKSLITRGVQGSDGNGELGELYLNYNNNNPVYVNGKNKIYHEGNKPSKGDVGLNNVDNTSDLDKPISNAVKNAFKDFLTHGNTVRIENRDLNTLKDTGLYSIANCKNSVYTFAYCIVLKWNSNNDTCQILIPNDSISNNTMHIRLGSYNGAWSEFKQFSFEGHTHNKSSITDMPTKLSQFSNDTGFIKKSMTWNELEGV